MGETAVDGYERKRAFAAQRGNGVLAEHSAEHVLTVQAFSLPEEQENPVAALLLPWFEPDRLIRHVRSQQPIIRLGMCSPAVDGSQIDHNAPTVSVSRLKKGG